MNGSICWHSLKFILSCYIHKHVLINTYLTQLPTGEPKPRDAVELIKCAISV